MAMFQAEVQTAIMTQQETAEKARTAIDNPRLEFRRSGKRALKLTGLDLTGALTHRMVKFYPSGVPELTCVSDHDHVPGHTNIRPGEDMELARFWILLMRYFVTGSVVLRYDYGWDLIKTQRSATVVTGLKRKFMGLPADNFACSPYLPSSIGRKSTFRMPNGRRQTSS